MGMGVWNLIHSSHVTRHRRVTQSRQMEDLSRTASSEPSSNHAADLAAALAQVCFGSSTGMLSAHTIRDPIPPSLSIRHPPRRREPTL